MKRVLCLLTICFALVLAGCGGSAAGGLIPDAVPETEIAEPAGVKQVIMPRFLSMYYYEPKNDNW